MPDHRLYIGSNRVRLSDCLHNGHSAFSLPQLCIQLQQNKWPHSVAQVAVLSSRQSVQFRLARISSGTTAKLMTVCSSSSAGICGADSSGISARIVDTDKPSIVGPWLLCDDCEACLPLTEPDSRWPSTLFRTRNDRTA